MRNQTTAIMAFALALGIGIPAAAQTPASSPTSQPSTAPAPADTQSQPSQTQPSSSQPSQAPSASTPSSSAPSSSTQGQAGTSQAGAAPAQNDPVAQALGLTEDQQAKLQPIIQEEMSQINAVRNDTSLSAEQKQQKVDQIRQTEFPKIQAILTPDQRKKLADMQDQARQRANQGNAQSGTPSNTPPQPPH
jgi:protein CpxP